MKTLDRFAADTPPPPPTASPADRCAQLAKNLEVMAQEELAPRLVGKQGAERKAIVRAYWLAILADLGPVGQTLSTAMAQEPAA